MDRYNRQTRLPQIGSAGQARLASARVLLVGCGALGSNIAEQLVRAGVGFLRLVDRDLVEWTNLQRQVLFDEADAHEGTPKAIAAARRLSAVNSQVIVEPVVADVHAGNIETLAGLDRTGEPIQLMLDGTDNVETRYLLNDVAVKYRVPWVYGACVGTEGRVMMVRPEETACLRCIFPEPPGPAELATCDTAGVLGPAASMVASLQATLAIQWLVGATPPDQLVRLDLWRGRFGATPLGNARREDCLTCGRRSFEFLDAPGGGGAATSLCGRNSIQVRPATARTLDLPTLADRLTTVGAVQRLPFMVKCQLHEEIGVELTVFLDARAIISGTTDVGRARSIYARWIGS